MGIGFSIFLLAVGAILAFAVKATVAGIDIHTIGWILMAAGAVGLILTMVLLAPRRRRTTIDTSRVQSAGGPATPPVQAPTSSEREIREVRDEYN